MERSVPGWQQEQHAANSNRNNNIPAAFQPIPTRPGRDDNKSRHCPEPKNEGSSTLRAADIIKFFNRVADGAVTKLSFSRRTSVMTHHLAAKPGNNNVPSERNATLAAPYTAGELSSSPTGRGGGGGGGAASPTRHGGWGRGVSHPTPSPPPTVSRAEALNKGTLTPPPRAPVRVPSRRHNTAAAPPSHPWQGEERRGVAGLLPHPHREEEEEEHRVTVVELYSSESDDGGEHDGWPAVAATHRYHPTNIGQELQLMGEEKRLFLSNAGGGSGGRSESVGVGARLRNRQSTVNNTGGNNIQTVGNNNKRNFGGGGGLLITAGGGGDSDGMMGSGGESDSSEEIHYGPGFVSRLKSRYMSVALRGSARGSLMGSLRRSASLEDFLDIDKSLHPEEEEVSAVMMRHTDDKSQLQPATVHFARNAQVRVPTAAAVPSLKVFC